MKLSKEEQRIIDQYFKKKLTHVALTYADDILFNDTYNLPCYPKTHYPNGEIDWYDAKGRSYQRVLHGFVFLADLLSAYENKHDQRYADKGLSIIEAWIQKFEDRYEDIAPYHDETTALRQSNWIVFYVSVLPAYGEERLADMKRVIDKTADLLAKDSFYAGVNNHGMYQDFALILYYIVFKEMPNAAAYKTKALKRLKEYFSFVYTNDGVHREHTPLYHYLITRDMHNRIELFRFIDEPFAKFLQELYEKSLYYSTYIIKPDGCFPQIGDSECGRISDRSEFVELYDDPIFKWSLSSGREGKPPKETSMLFPDAGYAIFRNSWEDFEHCLYFCMTAAYHTKYHKHCDDLSILVHKGGDILVEAGCNGFDYKDPMTRYSYSCFAHNTLVVDDSSLPRVDGKYDCVYIEDGSTGDQVSTVSAVNKRYHDTIHKRRADYYGNDYTIVVSDTMVSPNPHNYKLLWDLAADVDFIVSGDGGYLVRGDKCIGELRFTSAQAFKVNVYRGFFDADRTFPLSLFGGNPVQVPIIKGYNFPMKRECRTNKTVEVEFDGMETAKLTTSIVIYENEKELSEIAADDRLSLTLAVRDQKLLCTAALNGGREEEKLQYSFTVLYDGKVIEQCSGIDNKTFACPIHKPGAYQFRVHVRTPYEVISRTSEPFIVE